MELARTPVVNDGFEGLPFVIVFDRPSATITAFERRVGDSELTFHRGADGLIDEQTSSVWDPVSGRAIRGSSPVARLTPVAGIVAHPRSWQTLHPNTEIRTARPGMSAVRGPLVDAFQQRGIGDRFPSEISREPSSLSAISSAGIEDGISTVAMKLPPDADS